MEFWALSCSFTSLIFFSQSRLVHGVEFLLLHMFHIALAWKFMFYASWYHPDPSSLFSQPSICSIHVSIYQRLPRHLPQYLTINSTPFACISYVFHVLHFFLFPLCPWYLVVMFFLFIVLLVPFMSVFVYLWSSFLAFYAL